ncbi:MAG: thioredoxin domain-containing protein, partial [Parcubacteria group bacterium]|nr:thioredoxin domain-containing protein [Parcubacteria group bacterium]
MQNDSAGQKPTHTIRNAALSIALAGVLIFLILFVKQVLSIRNEILSGTYDFERYGEDISGSGGANIDQSRTFDVATQDDPSLGPPDAAVTIVEFGDFECPFCLKAFPIIRSLAQAFKDDVRLVYRDFPLDSIHPTARVAALAGYCAHAQGL